MEKIDTVMIGGCDLVFYSVEVLTLDIVNNESMPNLKINDNFLPVSNIVAREPDIFSSFSLDLKSLLRFHTVGNRQHHRYSNHAKSQRSTLASKQRESRSSERDSRWLYPYGKWKFIRS